ncbi:MAG: hypothetical protein KGD63_05245 [Candidatus Lokiarchaeota archaeon]|nr:hypothetical protein [Candidatus Lokiarchaeota archaeon]
MPTISHFALGGIIGICLYFISEKKFSKYHVFILFLNNFLGPDVGWIFGIGRFTHSLFGWIIFGFILTIAYHYFTKFTIKIKDFKNIEIVELKEFRLSYLNTLFLVTAGGILHNYLDEMINYGGTFNLFPQLGQIDSIRWSLDDFINLWSEGILQGNSVISIIIGFILVFSFILVFILFLKKTSRLTFLMMISHMLIFLILFYLLGQSLTFHSDAGAIVFVSIYWGIPFLLCVLSTQNLNFLERRNLKKKDNDERTEKKGFITIKLIFLSIGIFFSCLSVFCLIFRPLLVELLLTLSFISQDIIDSVNFYIIGFIFLFLSGFSFFVFFFINYKEDYNFSILVISLFSFILAVFGIFVFLFIIFLNEYIIAMILADIGEIPEFLTPELFSNIIIFVGSLLFIFSLLNLIILIGLILRNRKTWRLTIIFYLFISWTIIGLVISCYLSKESVKEFFYKK